MKMRGVRYRWIEGFRPDGVSADRREMGFIAQELREVVPDAVWGEEQAGVWLGVNYDSLVPLVVEALKEETSRRIELDQRVTEQDATIRDQAAQLVDLQSQLDAQREMIERLSAQFEALRRER